MDGWMDGWVDGGKEGGGPLYMSWGGGRGL